MTCQGGSGQPIVGSREAIHIEFRTSQTDGLLFYTGRRFNIMLSDRKCSFSQVLSNEMIRKDKYQRKRHNNEL